MPQLIWICHAVSVTHFCGIRNCCLQVTSEALVDVTLFHEEQGTIQRRVKQHPTLINLLPVRQQVCIGGNTVEFPPSSQFAIVSLWWKHV